MYTLLNLSSFIFLQWSAIPQECEMVPDLKLDIVKTPTPSTTQPNLSRQQALLVAACGQYKLPVIYLGTTQIRDFWNHWEKPIMHFTNKRKVESSETRDSVQSHLINPITHESIQTTDEI